MIESDLIKRLKGFHLAAVQHAAAGQKLTDDIMAALDIQNRAADELKELKGQLVEGSYPYWCVCQRIIELGGKSLATSC